MSGPSYEATRYGTSIKWFKWRTTDHEDTKSTTVYFDVKCSWSAQLLLGPNTDLSDKDKYFLVIGGKENELSQIKYQFEGSTKSSYSHSPLSPTTYYGFWVSLDKQKDGNIHIDIGHANSTKPFMSWISEGEVLWDIRYLGIRSYGSSMCYFKNIRQHKAALDGKMIRWFKIP